MRACVVWWLYGVLVFMNSRCCVCCVRCLCWFVLTHDRFPYSIQVGHLWTWGSEVFGLGHSEGPGLEGSEGAEGVGKVSNKGGFDTIAGAADCPTPRKVPVAGRMIQVSHGTRSTVHVSCRLYSSTYGSWWLPGNGDIDVLAPSLTLASSQLGKCNTPQNY